MLNHSLNALREACFTTEVVSGPCISHPPDSSGSGGTDASRQLCSSKGHFGLNKVLRMLVIASLVPNKVLRMLIIVSLVLNKVLRMVIIIITWIPMGPRGSIAPWVFLA